MRGRAPARREGIMDYDLDTEHVDTVIIGAGQAGLAMGYHLQRRGMRFVILDAHNRLGQSWRDRWDSLRLFTPARYSGLPGLRFASRDRIAPTKDEMAAYLESYADRFELPVKLGVRVNSLSKDGVVFVVTA